VSALVLDTNVLIRFLERGRDYSSLFSRFDRLLIPAVVNGEYCAGADPETNAGRHERGPEADEVRGRSLPLPPAVRPRLVADGPGEGGIGV